MKGNRASYPFQVSMNYAILVDELKAGGDIQ